MASLIKLAFCSGLVSFGAYAATITFETLPNGTAIPDSTAITNQFPGLTFTNTEVISAFITLNEGEFPPHSGINVAFDDGGPITIDFATPIASFSGYFTYSEQLTIDAFGVGNTLLTSATSLYSDNEKVSGETGSSPNELLQVTSVRGISSVTITADPDGSSFTMDDISYTPAAATVPEPGAIWLLATGLAFLLWRSRAQRVRAVIGGVALTIAHARAQTVGMPEISPKFVVAGGAAQPVTVVVRITGAVIPSTVLLQEIDSKGNILNPTLGMMHDDGMNGDLKKNDGVYTVVVNLSATAGTPRFFQVSAGFTGMLKRIACGSAPLTPVASFVTDLTPTGIQTYLNNNKATVNSAATFLQVLDPTQFKKDWILMTNTLSSQQSNASHPRIIFQNATSTAIFGVGEVNENQNSVEYIQWVAAENKFHFHSINTTTGTVTADNPSCTSCHSGPDKDNAKATWPYPRPNWDAYDSWGGALPYNRDRIYVNDTTPTVEQKAIQRLLKSLVTDPVVSQLDLPPGITRDCSNNVTIVPDPVVDGAPPTIGNDTGAGPAKPTYDADADGNVTYPGKSGPLAIAQGGNYLVMHATRNGLKSDEGRGVAMFDNLTPLNALRVAQELADKFDKEVDAAGKLVQVVDIRPVALAIAGGGTDKPCNFAATNLTNWAPQAAIDAFFKYQGVKDLLALQADTLKKQESLPQIKADLEAATVKALLAANGDASPAQAISNQVFQRSLYGLPSQGADFEPDKVIGYMIDREVYGASTTNMIALFRLFLEPSKEPVNRWSLSLFSTDSGIDHAATYTFGDVWTDNYPGQIKTILGNATIGGMQGNAMSCAQLEAASLASFTAAFKNNPGYFK